jgi:hypothetical protein
MSKNAPTGVVISRCSFFNNHYSIYLQRGGSYWHIVDNTIVGDTPYTTESLDGEGIELNGYSVESFGHVVAHNRISNVADGISNGTDNIDVYGNDIFDVSDDGFEGDPGGANIRVWETGSTTPPTTGSAISLRTGRPGTSCGTSGPASWKRRSSSGRPTDRSSRTTRSSCGAR